MTTNQNDRENTDQNENAEQRESQEEQNRRRESKKNQFIKKFVNFHYSKTQGGGSKFLNEISSSNKITSSMKKKLEAYAKGISEFEGVNIDDIKYSDIMGELTSKLVVLNNNRNEFKNKVLKQYDISSSKYSNDILNKVEELDEKKLRDIVASDVLTQDFLKGVLGEQPNKKDLLKHFRDFNLKNKLNKLKEDERDIVQLFYDKINNKHNFSTVDFQDLFDTLIFSAKEKLEFVKQFVPTISLSEAIKLGLVSSAKAKQYRLEVIKEGLSSDENLSEDDVNVRRVARRLKDDNILIDIDRVVKNSKDAMRLMGDDSEALRKIRDDFNLVTQRVEDFENDNLAKDFEGFKEKLSDTKKIDGANLEKFKKGNIIALFERATKQGDTGYAKTDPEDTIKYFEILDDGSTNGKIKLLKRGDGAYDDSLNHSFEITYKQFLALATDGLKDVNDYGEATKKVNISRIEAYLKNEVVEKIQKGEILENTDKLHSIDIEGLDNQRQNLKDRLRSQLEAEIDENGNKKWTADQIQEKLDNNEEIKNLGDRIEESGKLNLDGLRKKLDEFDSAGSDFGFGEGVSFQVGRGTESTIYTIVGAEGGIIDLEYAGNTERITYEEFYATFKQKKAKRTSKATDFESLISSVQGSDKVGKSWKRFKFDNGKIYKKEGTETKKIDYPYLASIDSEEMVKIKSVDGDKVTFYAGSIKSKIKEDEKTGERKKKGEEYSIDKNHTYTVSVGWFDTYIKENNLEPRNFKEEGIDRKKENIESIEGMKGSFFSRLFKNYSIAEIMSGAKHGIEAYQQYLKEGNNYNSAKFAESVFGKFLPEQVRKDLKTRVEAEEKKHQDEYIEKLKAVDSSDATNMIISWLKNKDAPEYKKEAGIIFMMEKYGTLYAKAGLKQYKGQFLWYQAFGGSVNPPDKLFLEIKEQQEAADLPFNEEHLMYVLLLNQCKGKLKPHRRSRLHKEFKRFRASGKEEEIETGRRDSADERTIDKRIEGGMGELKGGTYPNAIGWAENVINKGGSMKDMNKIPFVMAFSGIAYNFDSIKILDAIKGFNGKGLLSPITRFMSHISDIEMLNKTIVELSNRIEARSSKYGGIGKAAEKIFNNRKSTPPFDEKKINDTEVFFEKYGEILTRSLYMLNDGKIDEDSHLSKLIFFEKDDGYLDENGQTQKRNKIFNDYYKRFRDLIDADTKWDNTDTMEDAFRGAGTSGFHLKNAAKNIKQNQSGGFSLGNTGTYMWEEIADEFDAVVNRRGYQEFGEGARKKLLEDNLRQFLASLLELHSSRDDLMNAVTKKSSAIGSKLRYWGVDLKALSLSTDYRSILSRGNSKADDMIDTYVDNILSKKNSSSNIGSEGEPNDYSKMEEVKDKTKQDTDNIL